MKNNARNKLGRQRTVRIYEYQEEILEKECEETGNSFSSIVRKAVNEYVFKNNMKKLKEP